MRKLLFLLLCQFGAIAFAQEFSQRYELVNLGKQVNTFYHEAAPVISPDGKTLYFFVQNHPENTFGKEGSQDIWVTRKDENGEWSAPEHLKAPFNNQRSNQVFNVLPDGSLFVRGGRGRDSKGFSIVSPDGNFQELDVKGYEEMEKGRFNGATISSDARHMILYFTEIPKSIRSDLYVSNQQPDGTWSRPEKLNITDRSDMFGPFIGPDDKTLYFASDKPDPNRQGGSDIYKATRLDDTWKNWSKPVNLGPPINTAAGDAYFSMDASGNVFTSRANSRVDGGNLDLFILLPKDIKVKVNGIVYDGETMQPITSRVTVKPKSADAINIEVKNSGEFETGIPETDQVIVSASAEGYIAKELTFPIPTLFNDTTIIADIYLAPIPKKLMLAGTVFDSKTNEPIKARVNATYKETNSSRNLDAPKGNYEMEINDMGWYVFNASAEGYLNAADSIEVINNEINPLIKDLYLNKIEVGVTVRLKNIYFDFDKTTLKSESFVELDKVVDLLKSNPSVEIEISGHTDSKGSDDYNLNLSQGRSQSVVDYLISQGIESYRLSAQGYGETKPIDSNDSEEGRANNRRVEFTVLKT
ncbi:MAG TPA: OmpA family protein [Cyclobacteriaceae bacterium]|nr:OmpA family protein [Cyclobacteriaceae bacterium]HNP06130.1 OmpA family protein [Cyclobacteriaceae bacterium]